MMEGYLTKRINFQKLFQITPVYMYGNKRMSHLFLPQHNEKALFSKGELLLDDGNNPEKGVGVNDHVVE